MQRELKPEPEPASARSQATWWSGVGPHQTHRSARFIFGHTVGLMHPTSSWSIDCLSSRYHAILELINYVQLFDNNIIDLFFCSIGLLHERPKNYPCVAMEVRGSMR